MKLSSVIAGLEIIIRDVPAPSDTLRAGEIIRALKALIALLKEEDGQKSVAGAESTEFMKTLPSEEQLDD